MGQNALHVVRVDQPGEPRLLIAGGSFPALSPDGRFLAYMATSMDRAEVFLTTFPVPGTVWPVSVGGGRRPVWNPRGGELFFTGGPSVGDDPNSHRDLLAVKIDTSGGVTVGQPQRLFEGPARGLTLTATSSRAFDVAPDGQRFLVSTAGQEGVPAVTVIDNVDRLIRARQ